MRHKCLLLLMLLTISACGSRSAETRNVKGTIMRYNQLVAECYRQQNMNPMQEVATPEHATKIYYHMAALGEGGVRMDSRLKKIEFGEVRFPKENESVVTTRETWDFTHYGAKAGGKQYEEKDFPYDMTYQLTRQGDHWLVTAITAATGKRQG